MLSFLIHLVLLALLFLALNIKKQIVPIKTQPVMVDVIIQKNRSHKKVDLNRLKNIHIASTKNQISKGHTAAKEKSKVTQPKGFTEERHSNGANRIKKKTKLKYV